MGHSQALCHINLEFYLGNGIVAWGHWTGQPIYILLVSVLVCVCACSFFSPYMTQAAGNGDASFWAIGVLLHWPLGKLIFAGVSRSSFNCFTSLISCSLTTNSSPLFLLLPIFLTSSQAVRPWGCQGRNKVTGWWARHPMSDHMDWCCARHHSRWLAQQGSSHNTRTYCRPGLFFFYLSRTPPNTPITSTSSLSISITPICQMFFVPPSVCFCVLSIFAFGNTCLLFFPTWCGG